MDPVGGGVLLSFNPLGRGIGLGGKNMIGLSLSGCVVSIRLDAA